VLLLTSHLSSQAVAKSVLPTAAWAYCASRLVAALRALAVELTPSHHCRLIRRRRRDHDAREPQRVPAHLVPTGHPARRREGRLLLDDPRPQGASRFLAVPQILRSHTLTRTRLCRRRCVSSERFFPQRPSTRPDLVLLARSHLHYCDCARQARASRRREEPDLGWRRAGHHPGAFAPSLSLLLLFTTPSASLTSSSPQMIPTLASCSFDEIVDAAKPGQVQFMQLYVNKDREITRKIVQCVPLALDLLPAPRLSLTPSLCAQARREARHQGTLHHGRRAAARSAREGHAAEVRRRGVERAAHQGRVGRQVARCGARHLVVHRPEPVLEGASRPALGPPPLVLLLSSPSARERLVGSSPSGPRHVQRC